MPSRQLIATGFCLLALVAGCKKCPLTEEEHERLKKELSVLKEEVEELRFGAVRLGEAAEAAFRQESYEEVIRLNGELAERHPGSEPAIRVELLAKQAKTLLAEAEEERRRKAEAERVETERRLAAEKREREARLAAERKAREREIAAATRAMRKKTDEVRGLTFHQHRDSSRFLNSRKDIFLYFATKPEWPDPGPLRLKIQYVADDWLFIEKYTIKADDQTFTITTSYGEVERDNGSGGIWEWYDKPASASQLAMVETIVGSKKAVLRYHGRQYYRDKTITANEKRRLKEVLVAYEALGGDI